MKSWQVLFKEAPAGRNSSGAQGESTSDQDFDDDADDALVEEGEALLDGDGDEEEEAESEEEEEQSDEDQDDHDEEEEEQEEEEEEELEEEEEEVKGFKFKDPKTGDFDFKRINQAVGGPELEKAFKEQTATITRTSQENKALKDQLASPELKQAQNKAGFFDHLMATHPGIQQEVMRILHGGNASQGGQAGGGFEIPGLDPKDPVAPVLQQLGSALQNIQNQLQDGKRQTEKQERDAKFVEGLKGARARFKELTGLDATEEQTLLIAKEMEGANYMNGARFVPDLFQDLILKAERRKLLESRKVKKKLPKTGGTGRIPSSGKGKRSWEDEQNDLWQEHMGGGKE
jgi:hypothetical protein